MEAGCYWIPQPLQGGELSGSSVVRGAGYPSPYFLGIVLLKTSACLQCDL